MNFYPRKRRTPPLQIISLIDILIVLLIFLVVSTTFKEVQPALNISLPSSRTLGTGTSSDGRLPVSLTKDGAIHLGNSRIAGDGLTEALARLRASRPDARLELRIDSDAPFGSIVGLWDALTEAGYSVSDVPARIVRPGAP